MQRWATLIAGMIDLLKLLGGLLVGVFRSHAAREAEMAFLRQQLLVLKRSAPARLRLRTADRLIFVFARASTQVPEPPLPASVLLLLLTLPDLPVLWASDLAPVPSPATSAAPNKLAR